MPDWLLPAMLMFGFLAVMLGPLAILLLPDLGRHRTLHELLARLALKGVGRLDDVIDGPMPIPRLTARAGERELTILPDLHNEDEHPGALVFQVTGPLALPRFEVRPRDPAGRSLAGMSPAPLTDALLERRFEALVDDPAWWQSARPLVERALERLGTLGEKPAFALTVNRRRLQLRRLVGPKEEADMEALVIRVAELVDALLANAAATAPAADPECCYRCGAALARIESRCRRCRTPYHAECFRSAGGCALYPCSCTTAVDGELELAALPAPQS